MRHYRTIYYDLTSQELKDVTEGLTFKRARKADQLVFLEESVRRVKKELERTETALEEARTESMIRSETIRALPY